MCIELYIYYTLSSLLIQNLIFDINACAIKHKLLYIYICRNV